MPTDRIELKSEKGKNLRIDYRMNPTAGHDYKVNHTQKMDVRNENF